jgi:hypothetical protein
MEPQEIEVEGTVFELLDSQFLIRVSSPDWIKGAERFVFYSDAWRPVQPPEPDRLSALRKQALL